MLDSGERHALDDIRQGVEKFGNDAKWVWFHAASLGEFEQGRPLIERLKKARPDLKILLTFFSPSGYKVRKKYEGAHVIAYLPFDLPKRVETFLDIVKPTLAVFIKYEFWGNYLFALKRRRIPTILISSIFRDGQIFFRPYGGMFRNMLKCFTRLYVQDNASRRRLAAIGINDVVVAGDTRFDRVADIKDVATETPAVAELANSRGLTLVIGSSWPTDEEFIFPWLNANKDVKAVIAPHEFTPARLEKMRARLGRDNTALLSELESGKRKPQDVTRIIVDCFGRLSGIYRYADIAYVGGGFGAGIHNINEAAVYGIPVIYGPNNRRFKEAADLKACGGGFPISSPSAFKPLMERLMNHEVRKSAGRAAANYIADSLGATQIILSDILKILK